MLARHMTSAAVNGVKAEQVSEHTAKSTGETAPDGLHSLWSISSRIWPPGPTNSTALTSGTRWIST
ncbi:hypothetical protein JB92DRAFT_2861274 [Gautieria morchelliformis]|nr:hypothetical protein JB92DRAFT_2861274 [Gautieria morchelliformis]